MIGFLAVGREKQSFVLGTYQIMETRCSFSMMKEYVFHKRVFVAEELKQ